jgi:glycine C-acetyltransferase
MQDRRPVTQEVAVFAEATNALLQEQLQSIRDAGTWKDERVIVTPQSAAIGVRDGAEVLNFCANNYLGLSDDAELIEAAKATLDERGFGMSSVRFICGTLDVHKQLERELSAFLGMDDTILYSSCFDANGGLFETLLAKDDAVISDSLNHASIIDGVRLCKAARYRYANNDMDDLRAKLQEATDAGARLKLIATDGVFSMDGYLADLGAICDLADEYGALVMVDDSHAVGFIGRTGRGTHEHCGVMGRVDIITGTLGKALGGASGGYTSARGPIVELLRQRSRPYLFSNTLAPVVAGASLAALRKLSASTELRDRLEANSQRFRAGMQSAGFDLLPGEHPIVPVMLGDARLATQFADALLERGIYVIGFSYPVVPRGLARIRVQRSRAGTRRALSPARGCSPQVEIHQTQAKRNTTRALMAHATPNCAITPITAPRVAPKPARAA